MEKVTEKKTEIVHDIHQLSKTKRLYNELIQDVCGHVGGTMKITIKKIAEVAGVSRGPLTGL